MQNCSIFSPRCQIQQNLSKNGTFVEKIEKTKQEKRKKEKAGTSVLVVICHFITAAQLKQ